MSTLTLQEIMLGLTFLLTLLNILNGWNAARSRKVASDPAITDIREQMIKLSVDLTYLRSMSDKYTANAADIANLRLEVANLRTEVRLNAAKLNSDQ